MTPTPTPKTNQIMNKNSKGSKYDVDPETEKGR